MKDQLIDFLIKQGARIATIETEDNETIRVGWMKIGEHHTPRYGKVEQYIYWIDGDITEYDLDAKIEMEYCDETYVFSQFTQWLLRYHLGFDYKGYLYKIGKE